MHHTKRIPIGIDDFKKLITNNYYYIDKTKLIEEILEDGSEAVLFTRPRRFGKTLNMSMLKYFFEDFRELEDSENTRFLFNDLYIANSRFINEQGKYPVITLSFKDCKWNNWQTTKEYITDAVKDEYLRHEYLMDSDSLSSHDKKIFESILEEKASEKEYLKSILTLSRLLKKHHKKSCIILLDEYDVPLQNAYVKGFYDDAVDFIKNLFSITFKQNFYLKFSIITGCLRISRESIFTGWNNLSVQSILDNNFSKDYGITLEEKDNLLEYYNLQNEEEMIKKWYDGYNFNGTEIYNPWDLLNYVSEKRRNPKSRFKSYWINSSSNDVLKEMLEIDNNEIYDGIENLISGKKLKKNINESLTYGYLKAEPENVWSLLLFTGYLTADFEQETEEYVLRIPNYSIKQCYEKQIKNYLDTQIKNNLASELEHYMINNDGKSFQMKLESFMLSSLSYYDNLEAFYHGFVTGLCTSFSKYLIKSNVESGDGRADVILYPKDIKNPAIILEFKWCENSDNLQKKADKALKQIQDKKYAESLGAFKENARKFGIAFCGKECKVSC